MALTNKVKSIFVALFLGSILLPIALDEWMAVDTSAWNMAILGSVWEFIPVIGLVGIILTLVERNL